eukprot:gnl/TRDRNA2_/TRDRNA2_202726_c0_seq1.p1 gnl/TRDRNA2_/TRDRNA2_202726_c0~~gnl/TRDRNA2_/TRDRNA2_202726_c0_seq1.p1  ORF type:complete len:240 (+),score=54.72 gnl/TRDRNA2_/TRDRNA2_202726_c0_seq1:30-749(+)
MSTAWVVLGIQLLPDGAARDMLRGRCLYAAEMFKRHAGQGDVIIGTGGMCRQKVRTEASAVRELLVAHGVEDGKVLEEGAATNYQTNASCTVKLLQKVGGDFRRVVVVGTDYQGPNVRKGMFEAFGACFEEVFFITAPFKTVLPSGCKWDGEKTEFADVLVAVGSADFSVAPWIQAGASNPGLKQTDGAQRRWQAGALNFGSASGGEERRRSEDGKAYTKKEFKEFFGGYKEWDRATPV